MTVPPTPDHPEPGGRLPALGRRGGGWVALQVAIFALAVTIGLVGAPWPAPVRLVLWVVAAVVGISGGGLLLAGGAGLGRQLTPFPRPVDEGELRQDGIYGYVRHPIYGGVLLLILAWALASSPLTLLPWVVAALFFDAKRRREEVWLLARYSGYADYRQRVTRSFVPFVW